MGKFLFSKQFYSCNLFAMSEISFYFHILQSLRGIFNGENSKKYLITFFINFNHQNMFKIIKFKCCNLLLFDGISVIFN